MATLNNIYCVCRVCLAEDKVANLKNMFNFSIKCNDEKSSFSQLYCDYTGISLNSDEELSPYCCSKCETAIIIAFNFRKAVKESNEFLEHILKKIQTFEEMNTGVGDDEVPFQTTFFFLCSHNETTEYLLLFIYRKLKRLPNSSQKYLAKECIVASVIWKATH